MENSSEKHSLAGLAARLSRLPSDKRRAAVEASAALAGVSFRVGLDFVEAIPAAAEILTADQIRLWAEIGRKLAMGNSESGSAFFASGADALRPLTEPALTLLLQIALRQLVLSSSAAINTLNSSAAIAAEIGDDFLVEEVLRIASGIAERSAKHSSDFLSKSPAAIAALKTFGKETNAVAGAAFALAMDFANRTGGMTADMWSDLPKAISGLDAGSAINLLRAAQVFLKYGGSVTLHFLTTGGDVMRADPDAFSQWCNLLEKIAPQGNATVIAFLRSAPAFFRNFARRDDTRQNRTRVSAVISKVLELAGTVADNDPESALALFRSGIEALRKVPLDQFEEWVKTGLKESEKETPKSRRSYFALETRRSRRQLSETGSGIHLESVIGVLRVYVEGLTGREVEIEPLSGPVRDSRLGDGKTIYLPASISEFGDPEKDFRLYKVLAAHSAGQIEFGTFERDTGQLAAAYREIADLYSASAEDLDAFSLAGYLEDIRQAKKALTDNEIRAEIARRRAAMPAGSDYRTVLKLFPDPRLARRIFGMMENARIGRILRFHYRGLRKDLDLTEQHLAEGRPYIFDLPADQVPFELLFQIALCGGVREDARQFYGQAASEIEEIVSRYLQPRIRDKSKFPTVADSLFATSRVYSLFQSIAMAENTEKANSETDDDEEKPDFANESADIAENDEAPVQKERRVKQSEDVRDLFNAWNEPDDEDFEPDNLQGSESWIHRDVPEQPLEAGDLAFAYDEWDRELNDYRVGWSRVIEKKVKTGDRTFVELTRSRYRGVISSIRRQFQLMKPENLMRIHREPDGEDYDLGAVVDYVIDRKADGRQSENIYTKRLRRERDVAVSILLDQSSSTARTITRNPLQPYTYPGRRIIEIEKEGLVLMSEALEAVGDPYSIYGFTSEGRRNVKFYVVKDFHEPYSEETERRIGGITFQNNTRLGAAIRHAADKLLRQESRTRLLIILTDGRPYDHDYGDARYAREDVREALTEAKIKGITPFCITIDRESEAELRDLYGDVGYTIIDDVLSLPERMPNIYRRLTT